MTGLQTLAARAALGGVAGLVSVALPELRFFRQASSSVFNRIVLMAFVISRLTLFLIIFIVLNIAPRGDVGAFYFSEASAILRGALPYLGFTSSYAPLHGYVDATVLLIWRSPLALILFAIVVEFVLLAQWLRWGRKIFSEPEVRVGALLYLASAISLQFVAIDGQDNVLIALLILVALGLALRSRAALSGVTIALSMVAVKLIPIFYAPVFFAGLRRRWQWALAFTATVLIGYGSFALLHAPILQPLAIEGHLKSAGTLPYLIESLTGWNGSVRLWNVVTVLGQLAVYLLVWRRSAAAASEQIRTRTILWGITASTLVLLVLANKSWPPYLALILFPICVLAGSRGRAARVGLALFGVIALVEHSYWATLLEQIEAPDLHAGILRHDRRLLIFLLIELLLLSGYAALLWLCLKRLGSSSPPGDPEPVAEVRP